MPGSILIICDEPGFVTALKDYLTIPEYTLIHQTHSSRNTADHADDFQAVIIHKPAAGWTRNGLFADPADRRPTLVIGGAAMEACGTLCNFRILPDTAEGSIIASVVHSLLPGNTDNTKNRNVVSSDGRVTINLDNSCIIHDGIYEEVSAQEAKLLSYLIEHEGEEISREELLALVWGYDSDMTTRTIDVHIARLRHKMGDTKEEQSRIRTVRKVGYQFVL